MDCLGLLVLVAKEIGLDTSSIDIPRYGRVSDGRSLIEGLNRHLDPCNPAEMGFGDVLVMRASHPCHTAILVPGAGTQFGIVHAYAKMRRVVEHDYGAVWAARFVASFRFVVGT